MDLRCNPSHADHLHGPSQKVRVITEQWFEAFGYCLNCPSNTLTRTQANSKARDFVCETCGAPYELKSCGKAFGARIVDGEYKTMLRRIATGEAPSLILLQYSAEWIVQNLTAVHSIFLTPGMVEGRTPLTSAARRAGWQGCNLLLHRVPLDGRIALVTEGQVTSPEAARGLFAQSVRFGTLPPAQRGWTALVLAILRRLERKQFTLDDVLAFEPEMRAAYPQNRHLRAKLRQQLQVLRDLGYLEFLPHPGEYRLLL